MSVCITLVNITGTHGLKLIPLTSKRVQWCLLYAATISVIISLAFAKIKDNTVHVGQVSAFCPGIGRPVLFKSWPGLCECLNPYNLINKQASA